MRQGFIGKLAKETGSTLIEFTMVLTILLALTFAIVDFGRYVYANNIVISAAQEGARAGITTSGDPEAAARDKLITLDPNKATVSAAYTSDGLGKTYTTVNVTYEFEFVTPFIGAAAGGPINIDGSASKLRWSFD